MYENLSTIGSDRVFYFLRRWYPPGHGDFYQSFNNSGLLDKFISDVSVHFMMTGCQHEV